VIRALTVAAVAMIIGGLALAITGGSVIGGILIFLTGLVLEALLAAIAKARAIKRGFQEWYGLLRGGVTKVRILSVEAPPGWLFNHDATVTLELHGKEGQAKTVQREFPVPRVQALVWQLGKRAPGAAKAGPLAQRFRARLQVQLDRAVELMNRRRAA
jgi:hypothetical protein